MGILIVTRRIEQANEIVSTINTLAGRVVAVAHHSDSRATPELLDNSDVVVITHQAYVNAARGLRDHVGSAWDRLLSWRGGQRLLTIIDEALANVVETSKLTVADLGRVIGYIPVNLRAAFPQQVIMLEELRLILLAHTPEGSDRKAQMVWGTEAAPSLVDMSGLRKAMADLPYDKWVASDDASQRARIARFVEDVLTDAECIQSQWAYYTLKGSEHSLNTAALAVPKSLPGPVVLDATARADFLWDLFERRARIEPTPSHVRDYSPVTLHVARARGVGKTGMIANIKSRWSRALASLEAGVSHGRFVFACVHKAVEHAVLSVGTPFQNFSVGHWGAIDGRNDWASYDVAVIFGLPYRDHIWATNTFYALQGEQDDAWLRSPGWKQYGDVRRVMQQRQLSVSIIQAINRVRCRKVIDAEGRCEPTDIFIVLPEDRDGDAILEDIRRDMPGLNVVVWAFDLDGPEVRKPRAGSSHAALVAYMRTQLPGQVAFQSLRKVLNLTRSGMKKLATALRDESHETTRALKAMGVEYRTTGTGRGAISFLAKYATA